MAIQLFRNPTWVWLIQCRFAMPTLWQNWSTSLWPSPSNNKSHGMTSHLGKELWTPAKKCYFYFQRQTVVCSPSGRALMRYWERWVLSIMNYICLTVGRRIKSFTSTCWNPGRTDQGHCQTSCLHGKSTRRKNPTSNISQQLWVLLSFQSWVIWHQSSRKTFNYGSQRAFSATDQVEQG